MSRRTLDRCCGMWLLTVSVSLGCALCGRLTWCAALAAGGVSLLLYNMYLSSVRRLVPGPVRVLQVIWLAVPLSVCASAAASLFPDAGYPLYICAVVLTLGWLLAQRPRAGLLACCVVLGFFVLAAVGVVTVFGVPEVRWSWLAPAFGWEAFAVALALASGAMLLGVVCPEARPGWLWRIASALAPTLLCAVTAGCLSPELSRREASAFYTLSRSISLFGVVERFEALIAACLTLGLCGAIALLFRAAGVLCGRWAKPSCGLLLAGALLLSARPLSAPAAALGTIVLWVVAPLVFPWLTGERG